MFKVAAVMSVEIGLTNHKIKYYNKKNDEVRKAELTFLAKDRE